MSDDFPEPRDDDWIIVPKWSRFQHYHDREPVWLKVYTKLLSDPSFLGLSFAARGLLVTIWLAYCRANGQLSIRDCDRVCDKRLSYPQLKALYHAGFVEISASKPLALARAREEEETEREIETPQAPLSGGRASRTSKGQRGELAHELLRRALEVAADWPGGPSDLFAEQLDELEREYGMRLPHIQREQLWDVALKRRGGPAPPPKWQPSSEEALPW